VTALSSLARYDATTLDPESLLDVDIILSVCAGLIMVDAEASLSWDTPQLRNSLCERVPGHGVACLAQASWARDY
jgi:hypothetical protein